jgi:hypothetical protein
MTDVIFAALFLTGSTFTLEMLETQRYLAGPAAFDVSFNYPVRPDSLYCHKAQGLSAHFTLSQPLLKVGSGEFYAQFAHESCFLEQLDKGTSNSIGLGFRAQLDHFWR